MKIKHYILFAIIAVLFQACAVKKPFTPRLQRPINLSDTKITLQDRRDFVFEQEGVSFSNKFASARANEILKVNDSTFNVFIQPENEPINPSPWFAFKVWGTANKNVYLNLNYLTAKHRYQPKTTTDGVVWKTIENAVVSADKEQASFIIKLSTDTLTVAAQEIISSGQSYVWMDGITKKRHLGKEVIGSSVAGKPIVVLNSTKSNGKKLIVILSRQHPPEVSGYMAMTEFVETLLGKGKLSRAFRKEYELVIFPMVNPDGVDEGNWRHNFGGVDLNRDWMNFREPETRAIRDYLLHKIDAQNAKVIFALDFHSTFYDILYTNIEREETHNPGLLEEWIKGLHAYEGAIKTRVEASTNAANLSKDWLGRNLKAEAVIYEVGDNTPRSQIKRKANKTALILMEALLRK